MKKTLVIYKSKTGFTERYARWIAEDVNADVLPLADVDSSVLEAYTIVVFGGPLFASRILDLGKVQSWMEKLPKKTWVVFATGATPSEADFVKSIEKINFPPETPKPARFYYFLGGMDFEKMGWFNRLLIRLFGRLSQKKHKSDEAKQATPPSQFRSFDLSDRSYIDALVKYVRIKQ